MINGLHFNSGCCFDYGNAKTDSRTTTTERWTRGYYGDAGAWYHGSAMDRGS